MAINEYEINGERLWSVYVNIRHREHRNVRCQKRVLGLKTETAALQEEKKLIRSLTEDVRNLAERGPRWGDLVDAWEISNRSNKDREISQTTFVDNLSLLTRWTKDLWHLYAKEIGRGEIRLILKQAEVEGKSRSFQINLKAAISGVYRWAIEENKLKGLQTIPTEGVLTQKKIQDKPPEILTLEEIRTLLKEAKAHRHPWYPIWAVALLTGMRAGELHALVWSDVDFERDMIVLSKSYNFRFKIVKSTKAGYWRNIPMSSELKSLLLELKAADPEREHVLPRFSAFTKGGQAKVLRAFCTGIGIKPVKFHTLRACFATQLLANAIQPARVMKICGWKDLATMERYIRLAGLDERGATECLTFIGSDAGALAQVVNLFDFKAERPEK